MRSLRNEDGALLPIVAVAISGIVVASMWAANTAGAAAVRHETQRAADLAALAGAADIPLIGALSSDQPGATACAELARAGAPLGKRLSGSAPACGADATITPIVEWNAVDQVRAALSNLQRSLGLATPSLCQPLVAAAIDPFLASLTATDCARVQQALNGMPDNISPAVVSPRVQVDVSQRVKAVIPIMDMGKTKTIRLHAIARRRFKNLIVLPAVKTAALGLPQPVADAISGAPADLSNINPNPAAATVRDTLMRKLFDANARIGAKVNPLLPAGYEFDLSELLRDVQDLYDPPTGATPPSPLQVAAEAARTGDPVVVLRLFRYPLLGIPAFDFTAAYLSPLAAGHFQATPIPVSQLTAARGLFAASLVK
jgi:hypothetical protein